MFSSVWVRIIGVLVLIGALWGAYSLIEQRGYDRCQKEMQEASLKLAWAYADRINQAERDRDEKQITIDRLAAELDGVLVHVPVCPAAPGAENQNGAAGLFSQRVDESFARLQKRGRDLFKRCEELNLDAIKINAYAAEQP